MKKAEIYGLLQKERDLLFVVTFFDGDSYNWRDLDPCSSLGESEEPIQIHFSNCIGVCRGQINAYQNSEASSPLIFWEATEPKEPVIARYLTDDIQSIFDEKKGYKIYERDT
jgi:hypothetical protein